MSITTAQEALLAAAALAGAWLCIHAGCSENGSNPGAAGSTDAGVDALLDAAAAKDAAVDRDGDAPVDTTVPDVVADAHEAEANETGWATDPNGWVELTDGFEWLAPCHLYRADLSKVAIPPLVWEPCGTGCERTDVTMGLSTAVSYPSRAMVLEGNAYAHITGGMPGDPYARSVFAIFDLSTGAPKAAHAMDIATDGGIAECSGGALPPSPVLLDVSAHNLQDEFALVWDAKTGSWRKTGKLTVPLAGYLDGIDGLLGSPLSNDLYVSPTIDPVAFTKVFSGPHGETPVLGDQIVIPDWRGTGMGDGTHGTLQSWTPATGLQTLLEPDYDAVTAALSDTRIVWISIPQRQDSYPPDTTDQAQFHWSPRTTTASGLEVHDGATIPGSPPAFDSMPQTHGDYAAVVVGPAQTAQRHDVRRTAVTQLSTGKLWTIKARKQEDWAIHVWLVTDTHVYVGEGGNYGWGLVSTLVRYSFDHLDELEAQ